jgi:nucleoside kinase
MAAALEERPRDLLIAGHVNVDRFLSVAAFPPSDRTVPVVDARAALGGTAANLALVASGYGVRTGLVATVGDGFPQSFRARLAEAGVDLRGLDVVEGVSTPTCYIVVDRRGAQRTLIDQGPMGPSDGVPLSTEVIREYSWLHVTTGPPDRFLRLVRQARNSGLRVAADPAQEIHYRWDARRFRALLSESEILFGNRAEIARAVRLADARDPMDLLSRVPLIVRTEGGSGVTAFSRSGRIHVRARRPPVVRSIVGAGDAFRGGFYAGWFGGQSLERCLAAGVRAASRWVGGDGR